MKQMMKLSVTLALYTVVACLALAAVNTLTSPRILASKEAKTKLALQAIFPRRIHFDLLPKECRS